MAKIEEYNNGCGRIIINDINYEEIALDRIKKHETTKYFVLNYVNYSLYMILPNTSVLNLW